MKNTQADLSGQACIQMNENVIEIQGLRFAYNHHPVLEDVSMQVRKGEFLAVLGPNGGGKTTLMRILIGILQPSRGWVRVLGSPPGTLPHLVGYVPQSQSGTDKFPITVQETVLLGRLGHLGRWRRFTDRDLSLAGQALEKVGMQNYAWRNTSSLSGGQRQRVLIARALVAQPQILFLDEPTAAVDQALHTRFYDLLKELNDAGTTILVISHDLSVLSSHVKAVACVNRNLYYHDAAEISQEMLEKVYHCPVELITHGDVPHRVLRHH